MTENSSPWPPITGGPHRGHFAQKGIVMAMPPRPRTISDYREPAREAHAACLRPAGHGELGGPRDGREHRLREVKRRMIARILRHRIMGASSDSDDRPVAKVLFGDPEARRNAHRRFHGPQGSRNFHAPGTRFARNGQYRGRLGGLYLSGGTTKRVSFDLDGVKTLHHDMFCNVWEWAGAFREPRSKLWVSVDTNPTAVVQPSRRPKGLGRVQPRFG